MTRQVLTSVNRIAARVQSLQMDLLVRYVNTRDRESTDDAGYTLEALTEINAEICALQHYLRSYILGGSVNGDA